MALNFSKMNFSVSFNPTSAFPLDARSYFESYDAAVLAAAGAVAAGSTEGVLHFGQTIAVVENNVAQLYIIQPNGTLGEIGGKITVDTNAFELSDDGTLNLLGFAEAVSGAQLTKGADGKLSWVKPDTTTVDGLNIAIQTLQEKVGALETTVGDEDSGLVKDVADLKTSATAADSSIKALESKVGVPADADAGQSATGIFAALDQKADASNVLTKTETEIAINTAITNIDHLKRKIVDSLAEVEAYKDAADALHYIYMVPTDLAAVATDDRYDEYVVIEIDGIRTVEKVGSWEVDLSGYVKTETLDNYTTKTEFTNLSNTVTGLSGIVSENKAATDKAIADEIARATAAEQANATRIEEVSDVADTAKTTADEALAKAKTAQAGVDQINITIDGRLLTDDDKTKLEKLVIAEDGSVGVSGTINASNVKELDTWLETNGATYIKNLTENNLSSELVTKINFITSVNETDFTVTDGKLNLNIIDGTKVNLGTNNDFMAVQNLTQTHSDKIAALESLNVTVQSHTNKLTNLEEVVIPTIQSKFDNYVLNTVYTQEMAEIRDILSWKEMTQS